MSRNAGFVVLAMALVAIGLVRWRSVNEAHARERWSTAIRSVFDTTREAAWVATFDKAATQPLSELDPAWKPLFGRLFVDSRLGAVIGDPEGGWERDGGDDYSFRIADVPTGSLEIVVDGWWDGHGSFGAQGNVQSESPHRLYEATLWRGKLTLIYFLGPAPDHFEVLAEAREPAVSSGFYRIRFCVERRAESSQLSATLHDPERAYAVVGRASASDARLAIGGTGIGMLGAGGRRSSYITGVAVRSLESTGAGPTTGCGASATKSVSP